MAAPVSNKELLIFGEFLAHLRQHGFTIGLDHYLRLHELLDHVGQACGPQDLKTLLCPLFATDANQQEAFYRAFDTYFELFRPATLDSTATASDAHEAHIKTAQGAVVPTRRRRLFIVAAAAALVMTGLVIVLLRPSFSGTQKQTGGQGTLEDVTLPTTGSTPAAAAATPEEFSARAPAEASSRPNFFQRHRTLLIWALVLGPLILFLFAEWRRFRRRRLVLQKEHGKKPPYVWPLRASFWTPKLYDSDRFYHAARSLRRRHAHEFYRLDVEATVGATLASLGYPTFRYKLDSKPPEYLALIERSSARDHQSQLFKALTRALEREDIFIEPYFYDDGDPRVCCMEAGGGCLHLIDLQQRFSGHRLLIFGNGELLVDPVTGKLKNWTKVFAEWPQRALLTPENPAAWGYRELSLATQFVVLPATSDGLSVLVDQFETQARADLLRSWVRTDKEMPVPRLIGDVPQLREELRGYLGEESFQWLCACAVYPELQWDLTLFLGTLPCMAEGLLNEKSLLRLARLPWFRTGTMPDELRWALIQELDEEKEKAVRQALIELLESNPPPRESFAHDAYQLNLVTQRWRSLRSRRSRRRMLEAMGELPRRQVEQDYTLLRFLESAPSSPLSLLLPSRLRKVFYHHGHAAFGLKTGARLLLTLFLIALLQVGIYKFVPAPTTMENKTAETPAQDKFMYPVVNGEWVWPGLSESELTAKPEIVALLKKTGITSDQTRNWRNTQFHALHVYRVRVDDNIQGIAFEPSTRMLTCSSCHKEMSPNIDRITPRTTCSLCHGSALPLVPVADLVEIPGGTFQMGRDDASTLEGPTHTITLGAFAMDRTEVTNTEYEFFVRETKHKAPSHWANDKPLAGQEQWPVTNVSYDDAVAFAAWRSQRDKTTYRLPTEEEWEFAARNGPQANLYPWGGSWEQGRAVVEEASPKPVGTLPNGKDRWGVVDLIGNVWEWTSTKATLYPGSTGSVPPEEREMIVYRGGSYATKMRETPATGTVRNWQKPSTVHPTLGFRLVRSKQ